ncbi:TBC1 domain family member 12-like isoform X2 [Rhopilema esculentum]
MRKMTNHKRNDSGQGSSITDASLNTIQNDLKRLDLTDEEIHGVESDENSCNNLTDSPRTLIPCQNPNSGVTNNCLDNDASDTLSNLEDGMESALPKARFSVSGKSTRLGPDSAASASFDEKDFTDIPLDSPGNKQNMNTYAPRPGLQGGSATSDSTDDLRKPSVTDTKTKSGFRLFRKDSGKSWKIFGNQPIKVPTSPQNQAPSKPKPSAKKPVMATSTTALILENRPANLPPKSAREEQRHKQLYEEMLKGAKKKEESDLHKELKKTKQQKQQEKGIVAIQRIWKEDVIPNWDAVKNTKKVKDLWWNGLPSSVRGKVWMLAIGNDLHITPELFQILQAHAVDKLAHQKSQEPVATLHDSESSLVVSKENTVGLISLDVARTFPALCIFQKGGPYHDSLKNLLGAYTCYRPDVGYVQGMSFIAAMLLLNMDTVDAFICFSNLMHKPCQMAFFMVNQPMMEAYFSTFDVMLEECAPRIHSHFQREKLSHDIYLIDWIFTLYSKSLPLDIASRVWDLFCRDGEDFLFRTALGILTLFQETLCNLDFFHLAQYLTKMSGEINSDSLFQAIAALNFNRQKFQQVLAFYRNQNSLGNTR